MLECVRCKGTGKVRIIDYSTPDVLFGEEWPLVDTVCHGCGGSGKTSINAKGAKDGEKRTKEEGTAGR